MRGIGAIQLRSRAGRRWWYDGVVVRSPPGSQCALIARPLGVQAQRPVLLARSASITAAEITMRPPKRNAGSSFVLTHS